jgi:c-di-GMP-binding flagellar brake protein YcgR
MKDSVNEAFDILKTGTMVEIGILVKNRAVGSYPGYIRQLTEYDKIEIGLPSLIDQELPLIKGHLVKLKIATPDGLYSFQGQVLDREEGFFSVGHPVQLELLQRREHTRFPIETPAVFQVNGKSVCTGHTADISVGGALLLSEVEMKVGDQLKLQLILQTGVVGDSICGEVMRRMVIYLPRGEGRNYIYGVSFVQISDYDREAILSCLSETNTPYLKP